MHWKEYLFVDGYNIINDWDELKKISRRDLEQARIRLINIMTEYNSYKGIILIIVFDAHLVKSGNRKTSKLRNLQVVYTKENETADAYIEKAIDKLDKRARFRVATSDGIIQQIVLGRGGTRISSREMNLEVEAVKRKIESVRVSENEKNNIVIGRLGEDNLEKLEKLKRNLDLNK